MRIGVISDTHIPDRAEEIPAQIIEDFKKVDMIVHAGDLVDLKVLDKLKSICPKVVAVWGNMDPREVRSKLSEKEIFEVAGHRIGLMHGFGAPVNLIEFLSGAFRDDAVEVVIFGHAHCPVNEKRQGVLYFNPGSPTDKIYCQYNSYGIIEINDKVEARIVKIKA